MADYYIVYKSDKDSQWYFRRIAANNEIVATSEGYTTKEAAHKEASRQASDAGLNVHIQKED